MDQHHPQDAPEVPKKGFLKTAMRPVSLLVVAFTLLGSLLMIEQTDTATTAPDPGLSVQPLGEALDVAHMGVPHRPTTVAEALQAAALLEAEVDAAIARVSGPVPPGNEDEACAFLLQVRARFIARIAILIDLVPDAEDELLDFQADVLVDLDLALLELDCVISG